MPRQLICASALPGKTGKHENGIFHSNAVLVQQSLLDFFNLFDSRLILTRLYDSLNLAINAISSGLFGAWFRRKDVTTSVLSSEFPLSQGNAEAVDR